MGEQDFVELPPSALLEMIRREQGSLTRRLEERGLRLPGRSAVGAEIPGFMSATLFNPPTAEFFTEFFRSPVKSAIELNRFGPAEDLQPAWEKIVHRYAESIEPAIGRFAANVDGSRVQFFSNNREDRIRAAMTLHGMNAADLATRPFADGLALLARVIPVDRSTLLDEMSASGTTSNLVTDEARVRVSDVLGRDFGDPLLELNVVLDVLNCLPWVFPDLDYKTLIQRIAESWSSGRQYVLDHPEIRDAGEYYRVCVPLWNPHLVSGQAWIAGAIHVGFRPRPGISEDLLNGVIDDVQQICGRIEHKVEAARFENAVRRLHGTPSSDDQMIDALVDLTGCRALRIDDRSWSADGREHEFVPGDPVVEFSVNRGGRTSQIAVLPWMSQSGTTGLAEAAEDTREQVARACRMAVPLPVFSLALLQSRIRELRPSGSVADHDNDMICFLIVADLLDRFLLKHRDATGVSDFMVDHHVRFAVRERRKDEAHWGINKLLATQLGARRNDRYAYQFRDGTVEQYRLKLGRGNYPAASVTRDCLQGRFGEHFLLQAGLRARFVVKGKRKGLSKTGKRSAPGQVDAVELWRTEDQFDGRKVMKVGDSLTSEPDLSAELSKLGVDFQCK